MLLIINTSITKSRNNFISTIKSKNISVYNKIGSSINDLIIKNVSYFEYIIQPIHYFDYRSLIVFGITTRCDAFNMRLIIRNSIKRKAKKYKYSVFFFTGKGRNKNCNNILKKEAEIYNDIIQISCYDSYFNLTILTIWMIKWVIQNCLFKFFIKNDQDVVPNMFLINKWLNTINENNCSYGIVSRRVKPVRNNNSCRYIPFISYNRSNLPYYIYGYFAIYNYNHLKEINKIAFFTYPIIYREDIHIGYLSEKLNHSFCPIKFKIIQYKKIDRSKNLIFNRSTIIAIHGVLHNYHNIFNALNI